MDEFSLINTYFRPHSEGAGVVCGIGDDAALLAPTAGCELVMTLDTLLAGRHFPEDLPPADIGWRSLAVNLSDLAAMGATPRWCLLSLSLPEADPEWLAEFARGFYQLAHRAGVTLVGGDTVRGPLTISIQATGEVPAGTALRRGGARPGERICIGGVPGEAAAGLHHWQQGKRRGHLLERFCRPAPQLALGQSLRGVASACIDVSDGVLADLGHLLAASGGLGATLHDGALSGSLAGVDDVQRQGWQWAGGDDYLLLFTLPESAVMPEGCIELGVTSAEPGIRLLDTQGRSLTLPRSGWNHFSPN